MSTNVIIETIGKITKEELLSSLETNIYPNTCVVEAIEPFVGYYGSHPENITPRHIFLVLKGKNSLEEIIRITQIIKKNFDVVFDACLSKITLFNSTCQAIRIKDIDGYEKIREIQEHYVFEGIKMKTKQRKVKEKGLIEIEKSFLLDKKDNGIFIDKVDTEMAYFSIPRRLNWKQFEELTLKVKNNWTENSFDAALASFIRLDGIVDAVRIFSDNQDVEFIESLKKLYLKTIVDKDW